MVTIRTNLRVRFSRKELRLAVTRGASAKRMWSLLNLFSNERPQPLRTCPF